MRAGRSARNYPHLVAQRLGLDLVDVTYSGATTATCAAPTASTARRRRSTRSTAPRTLVTVTIGGNDVGYVRC